MSEEKQVNQPIATTGKIALALAKFQGEVENPDLNGENGHYKSKYALIQDVLKIARPLLAKNELAITQSSRFSNNMVFVTTRLLHSSGETLENTLELPAWKPTKNGNRVIDNHSIASSITYGKRIEISAMLGLAGEEDKDGNENVLSPEEQNKIDKSNENFNKAIDKQNTDQNINMPLVPDFDTIFGENNA